MNSSIMNKSLKAARSTSRRSSIIVASAQRCVMKLLIYACPAADTAFVWVVSGTCRPQIGHVIAMITHYRMDGVALSDVNDTAEMLRCSCVSSAVYYSAPQLQYS